MELADQVDHVVQGVEHAQAQQVELDQAGRGAVVLVPLEHGAAGHAGPLDRADLDHRPVADDHAPRVDAQVAGEVERPRRPASRTSGGQVVPLGERLAPVDRLGPGVCFLGGVPEGLAHVAERRAGPVGDDVGHLGGVQAAVALVDVLDDLFAPARLDVDVDVGRPVALGGEEPLEQQAEGHRVGVGDAEGVTDRRVGGRAPTLAEDVLLAGRTRRCPTRSGSSRGSRAPDDVQLVVDLGPRARTRSASRGP